MSWLVVIALLLAVNESKSCTLDGNCETNMKQFDLLSSLDDFPLDENGHLSTHVLLIPQRCRTEAERSGFNLERRQTYFIDEEVAALYKIASKDGARCPQYVCIDIGLAKQYLTATYKKWDQRKELFRSWSTDSCNRVEIGFINYLEPRLKIFWVDHNDQLTDNGELKFGERNTQWRQSFMGHRFQIRNIDTNRLVGEYTALFNGFYVVGKREPRTPVDQIPDHVKRSRERHSSSLESFEWTRSRRIKRTFTATGFAKGRVPDRLMGSIHQYFYMNKARAQREEWASTLTYVNHWEIDNLMTVPGWKIKQYWFKELQKLMERWCDCPLNPTDLYGIRTYQDGHWLKMHVDREDTHAVSAIVNVDQQGMREPWHLNIFDTNETEHQVEMAPGDIVYYESAKCMHGRPDTLHGESYTNVFVHFQPADLPEGQYHKWWRYDGPQVNKPRDRWEDKEEL